MTAAIASEPVRAWMSEALIAVKPETALTEVRRLAREHDVQAFPVIDGAGALRGILSTTDLLRDVRLDTARADVLTRLGPAPRLASELMTPDVVTVDEEATLSAAARAMTARHIHRLVVLRRGAPVAVIGTRDLTRALFGGRDPTPLADVMSTPVVTIDQGESVRDAIAALDDANVHGLVVVDGEWPVGVFTHREAMHARSLPGDLLDTPVERVMSYETLCLDVQTPLYRVAGHAIQMKVRRILAVEKRQLRGIVTGLDLAAVLARAA